MTGGRHSRRLAREQRTIVVMVEMYCRDHHPQRAAGGTTEAARTARRYCATSAAGAGLCRECAELLAYARRRVAMCPYGPGKPTCARCPTHCYKPDMREQVRAVMRYSGPRMLRKHPLLAAAHLLDGRRRLPAG